MMINPEHQISEPLNGNFLQYNTWRKSFLATIMRVVAGLGFLLLVTNIPGLNIAEIIIFSMIYLILLVVTLAPLPYTTKASALLISGYFVGVYVLLKLGPWSSASAYLLGTTLFAALLLDELLDRWVFALCTFTIALVGILNSAGYLTLADADFAQTGPLDWLAYLADYFVLALALVWAINLLKTEFIFITDQFHSAIGSLSKDRADLEIRVKDRTAGLLKKTDQLKAAAYIARQTADIQDLSTILKIVTDLITDQFGFYHAGIFLVNESGEEIILVSASSEGGRRMAEKGYSQKLGSHEIVSYAATQKKPRIALDTGADPVFFNNPDLPMTRSEIAVPMMIRERVLGVLDIQSDQQLAFSGEDIDVLHTLADQLAIAIENARLLEESQSALIQIENLTAVRTKETWSPIIRERNYSYTYTPLGIRAGRIPADDDNQVIIPITLRGQKIGNISMVRKDNDPWSDIDKDMINEVAYQTGLALDNMRLVEKATERAQQEQTLSELAKRFGQTMDVDSLLQTAARELGQVTDVAEVSVFIGHIPGRSHHRMQQRSSDLGQIALGESGLLRNAGYRFDNVRIQPINATAELGVQAMESGNIVAQKNNESDPLEGDIVAIPLKLRGHSIGVVTVKFKEGYGQNTVNTLEQAVERLAGSLESARLFEEARMRADREQAISHVTSAISSATEFDAILRTTVEEIGKSLGDTEVTIQLTEYLE